MILSCRPFKNPTAAGWNLLLLRDWHSPMNAFSDACFSSFDEMLYRLRADPNSTRPYLHINGSAHLSDLMSAQQAALRKIPGRYKSSAQFFTICHFFKTEPKLWIRLPSWIHLFTENTQGEYRKGNWELDLDEASNWAQWDLSPEESQGWLHLQLFNNHKLGFLSPRENPQGQRSLHFRLSEIIERRSAAHLMPSLSLCLKD